MASSTDAGATTQQIGRIPDRDEPDGVAQVPGPVPRFLPWLLVVGGAIGLAAALSLSYERVQQLIDPNYVPACSLNPVISCGSVMSTPQAAFFWGVPNSMLGIAAFAVVVTSGVVLLTGARLPLWYWAGLTVGAILGTVFVHYLIFQSIYRIGALCPWCMGVWLVTIPIAWYSLLATADRAGDRLPGPARSVLNAVSAYHAVPVVLWYLVVATLAVTRFWDYFSTLL
ncbi:vitamin K epoxide reductase family protein [Pseudonocardia phyllosphaerae]|uniref:vitamin K epoxide reductase family protein n=1 Tax=Pseudonocardia phyllosphaerae TaxID=3390502 RepID=UPI00397AE796